MTSPSVTQGRAAVGNGPKCVTEAAPQSPPGRRAVLTDNCKSAGVAKLKAPNDSSCFNTYNNMMANIHIIFSASDGTFTHDQTLSEIVWVVMIDLSLNSGSTC